MGCMDAGSSTTTSSVKLPKWFEDRVRENIKTASKVSKTPFSSYEGDRFTDFSPDETAAFDLIRGIVPEFSGPSGYSDKIMEAAGSPIMSLDTPSLISGDIKDYMNPYLDTVMADTLKNFNEEAGKDLLKIGAGATSSGAFGDARHGVVESSYNKDMMGKRGELINKMLSDAFGGAMGLKQQDIQNSLNTFGANVGANESGLGRMISGASTAAGTDTTELKNLLGAAGALGTSGGQQRALGQANADFDFSEFLRQQNYPKEMVDFMSRTLGTAPTSKTTETSTPTPSPLASVAGAGLNALSAYLGSSG